MFGKKQKQDYGTIDTIISSMTTIEGKIIHPKSLRIDGKLIGEISCEGDVYIGKEATAEPYIQAKNLYISGEVKGDVSVTGKIYLKSTGILNGTITSNGLIIEEGGIFSGTSNI